MEWSENSRLFLNTEQIDTNQTLLEVNNEIGGWTNNRQRFWFYVNFRTLLGDMYDKHEYFKMTLCFGGNLQLEAPGAGGYGTQSSQILVSGLDWVNSSYDTIKECNNSYATWRTTNQQPSAGLLLQYAGEREQFGLTFRKPMQMQRIDFETHPIVNPTAIDANINNKYPVYFFAIDVRPALAKPRVYYHNIFLKPIRLYLNTTQISLDFNSRVSNEIGGWDWLTTNGTARQVFWFNINFRTLLGKYWDTNKLFGINQTISQINQSVSPGSTPNVLLYMSGLNFRNSYDQQSRSGTNRVPIITRQINLTGITNTNADHQSCMFSFMKGEENVRLYFEVYDLFTLQRWEPTTAGVSFANVFCGFTIFPLD